LPARITALVKPLLANAVANDPNSIEDLPVIEMAADKPSPYVVIIYSGDGGWRDLDRTLGQVLSSHGVPVVGVDSLLYFWQPKRPEIVAHDLDRIIDHYHQVWHADHFVLVGYSFGADILPFAFNRLSAENQARVAEISLLALSRNTRFEISVSEYFTDTADAETMPVEPELAKLPPKVVQCFYGQDEAADSSCTTPAAKGEEIIETPGGHHFGDDYDDLATRIMDGAVKRLK
jgi:type IV secretory pathway VirJ component